VITGEDVLEVEFVQEDFNNSSTVIRVMSGLLQDTEAVASVYD
jgi:hypothetical protein